MASQQTERSKEYKVKHMRMDGVILNVQFQNYHKAENNSSLFIKLPKRKTTILKIYNQL